MIRLRHIAWLTHFLATFVPLICRATACPGQVENPSLETRTASFKISAASAAAPASADQHPLKPLVEMAIDQQQRIREQINDYTCYLVKRERIEGEMLPAEHLFIKFRGPRDLDDGQHVPFSIYVRVLAPKRIVNREILFVSGRHGGDMLVTRGGRRHAQLTLRIDPEGGVAMRDNRYPITAFGMENLLTRLIDVAQADMGFGECQVRILRNARVDSRPCTLYAVTHPQPRSHFRFHLAQIFVDDQWQVPVRFAAYSWPPTLGAEPVLEEEYTYRFLKFNVGLSDEDFNPDNPDYGFSLRE
jgi:hypothetical protein